VLADAISGGATMQLFLVPEDTADAAGSAFDRYRAYLKSSGADVRAEGAPGRESLAAKDPLYGNVHVARTGRFLVGAVRFEDLSAAKGLVGLLAERIGR
jgi:hypothetical protein